MSVSQQSPSRITNMRDSNNGKDFLTNVHADSSFARYPRTPWPRDRAASWPSLVPYHAAGTKGYMSCIACKGTDARDRVASVTVATFSCLASCLPNWMPASAPSSIVCDVDRGLPRRTPSRAQQTQPCRTGYGCLPRESALWPTRWSLKRPSIKGDSRQR